MPWPAVVTGLFGLGNQYLENKRAESQAKSERRQAQLRGDIDADAISAQDMRFSLKDEWLMAVFTAPFVLVFYASLAGNQKMLDDIERAFEIISQLPEWYRYILFGMVIATYGLRGLFKWVASRKMKV